MDITLVNGVKVPRLTCQIDAHTSEDLLYAALKFGYRSLMIRDLSAALMAGQVIAHSGVMRSDLFLMIDDCSLREHMMENLQTEYLDLVLCDSEEHHWKLLEDLYEKGILRAIGVCLDDRTDLEKLVMCERIIPMVNRLNSDDWKLHQLMRDYEITPMICASDEISKDVGTLVSIPCENIHELIKYKEYESEE